MIFTLEEASPLNVHKFIYIEDHNEYGVPKPNVRICEADYLCYRPYYPDFIEYRTFEDYSIEIEYYSRYALARFIMEKSCIVYYYIGDIYEN